MTILATLHVTFIHFMVCERPWFPACHKTPTIFPTAVPLSKTAGTCVSKSAVTAKIKNQFF